MSAIQAIKDYLSRMIGDIAGMKALYLDQETAGIVSMVLSQTQLLEKEIFLMRTLDKNVDSKIEEHFHLKAIIFVRPSSENVREIVKLISEQTFCEFHLFFSNIIHRDLLRSIASADQNDVVVEVHEIFADYFAVNNDLWTVNVRNTKYLLSEPIVGKDLARFNRIVDGIFANVLSFRSKPLIRYQGSSKLCKKIGDHVMEKIEQSFDMFDNKSIDEDVLLLIVDRREDPVTPLLTQWTYQAMIHELIGLENNKVDITPLLRKLHKKDHKAMKEKVDQRVFVLSQDQDQFFKKTMRLNYGDLGVAIKELVEDFQRKKDDRSKIDTIEDLQKIVENYDKIVSESGAVAKHVTLMTELSNIIDKRDLLKVSALEQRLACEQNHAVAVEEVRTLLNDTSISFKDKLKVVMLYALRYESVKNEIPAFKSMLRDLAMSDNSRRMIHFIDDLLKHAGYSVRSGDLFSNKDWMAKATSALGGLKGVSNIYTQHQPLLVKTLERISKPNKQLNEEFPYISSPSRKNIVPKEIFVFIVGGVTFEEAACISSLNVSNPSTRVILGGTSILNSSLFLQDVCLGLNSDGFPSHEF